ncbi:MAG: hypothetical protein GY809_16845, partial [Planctomycetes bacterium]|nr:hypothetical protein [Planctomycetota bacterium]
MRKTGLFWIVGLLLLAGRGMTQDLAEPIRILSVGKPIDTEVGHAAPFMCDYDGD